MKPEITVLDDIKLLVDTFYDKVRKDAVLGPVFDQRISDRWPEHLARMYTFWQTVLLEERTYYGSPFPVHRGLGIDHRHFDRWMELFTETVDSLFSGKLAEEAKWRAGKMAELFEIKLSGESLA